MKGTKPMAGAPGLVEITDLPAFLADLKAAIGPALEEDDAAWEREGPAVTKRAADMGITIDSLGGNCPVQAEGGFDGKRFYFRARGEEWQFHVADSDSAIFNDAWIIERDYGEGPYDAGWMQRHEAVAFICEGVAEFRARDSDGNP